VTSDKTQWADLASRSLGAGVIYANDELFADRENLIKPEDPVFQPHTFGNKGQVMDGWETRRRRQPTGDGQGDSAIVRLGCPGVVRRVVVDTSYFTGNYPPEVSVEACGAEGYPAPAELAAAQWTTLVPRSAVAGDARNEFDVAVEQRFSHVRLTIFPDGGVARLRVYGEPVPDPRLLPATIDLAALENGAVVTGCSNMFYSAPANLLMPGLARVMADGWETSRRRDESNDWVTVRLACAGAVEVVELDTSHFVGNAPGWAALGSDGGDLVARTALQPDTRHRFAVPGGPVAGQVRLDVYPDGGMARLRVFGQPTAQARGRLADRFLRLLPEAQLAAVLRAAALAPDEAARRAEARAGLADLPAAAHERFQIRSELSIKRKKVFVLRETWSPSWPSPSATTSTARRRSAWSMSPATETGTRSGT
jgi:allantoicase